MAQGYVPPLPRNFSGLAASEGVVFTCRGCGRARGYSRDDALELWGKQGLVLEIARRFTCRNCNCRGAAAQLIVGRISIGPSWAERHGRQPTPLDRFVESLAKIKPNGTVR